MTYPVRAERGRVTDKKPTELQDQNLMKGTSAYIKVSEEGVGLATCPPSIHPVAPVFAVQATRRRAPPLLVTLAAGGVRG